MSKSIQLVDWIGDVLKLTSCAPQEFRESRSDSSLQYLFFVFEIEIDGSVCHTGALGNLRDTRLKVTVLRDHQDCRIQDALIFVRVASVVFA